QVRFLVPYEEISETIFKLTIKLDINVILQSVNGHKFRNQVIVALKQIWPDMSFVHGRAHPQSQGSVERANADIKKMIVTWMRENKSTRWKTGLKFKNALSWIVQKIEGPEGPEAEFHISNMKYLKYEGPEAEFLYFPKNEDLNEPDDVFNTPEFEFDEIIPRESFPKMRMKGHSKKF
ncbi:unnamed protein product, partial [Brachionus calyciflorus]